MAEIGVDRWPRQSLEELNTLMKPSVWIFSVPNIGRSLRTDTDTVYKKLMNISECKFVILQ